jgi:DtxR family transcriptional regulator, manganese transport regulator
LKARLDRSNNNDDDRDHGERDSDNESINRLTLIRDAHNVNHKVIVQTQKQTDRMEDYLEVIYELIKNKGYATQTDISESLNVSLPGVTKMLQRLDERNYLKYEKYRGISLTQAGIKLAESIHEKHGLLSEFFKMIGVDGDIANIDAEGIEHHLHPQTLKKLREFMLVHKK